MKIQDFSRIAHDMIITIIRTVYEMTPQIAVLITRIKIHAMVMVDRPMEHLSLNIFFSTLCFCHFVYETQEQLMQQKKSISVTDRNIQRFNRCLASASRFRCARICAFFLHVFKQKKKRTVQNKNNNYF